VLHQSAGDPVLRERLLKKVWGVEAVRTRTLDTHITRLRKTIERDPAHPQHIQTVHGAGYRLQP
jgi:two-component system alkaline phosphatase synthesis response regulator PhoP